MRDAILLEKLKRGDPKGLELLMQAYLPYVSVIVWNILRGSMAPEDAEEVVSDVFLAAWNQAADLECGHIKSWLGAVARNKAKNKLRQCARSLPLEEDILDLPGLSDPTTQLEQAEEQELVRRAVEAGIGVKINAVSLDLGEDNWRELVEIGREHPVDVRFIEMMPIGYGRKFPCVDHRSLLARMKACYPAMEPDGRRHGYGPAVYYRIPGFKGSVGFISAIHGKFCDSCNRVRLTSQGYLKTCLCYEDGVDLRAILREGEERPKEPVHYRWPEGRSPSDGDLQRRLRAAMMQAIGKKPRAHCFERPQDITEAANMIAIGG